MLSSIVIIRIVVALQATISTQVQPLPPGSVVPAVDSAAVTAVRAQNTLMREYQSDLLQTVYWSLGAVALLVTVVIGFTAFLHLKLYDRDKAALEQALEGKVASEISQLRREVSSRQDEVAKELRDRFSEREVKVEKLGELAAQGVRSSLANALNNHRRELQYLKMEVLELQARDWEVRKVPRNAAAVRIEMLALAAEMEWENKSAGVLDEIERVLKAGAELDSEDTKNLFATFEKLPKSFEAVGGRIRRILEERGAT